jgi:hypothetical protein
MDGLVSYRRAKSYGVVVGQKDFRPTIIGISLLRILNVESRAQLAGTAPINPVRAQLVDPAPTAWIGWLIDLSRRNNLLFYQPIPTSSVDLTTPEFSLLELLAGRSVIGETSAGPK